MLSCNISAVPGRFTYTVSYEVTSDSAITVDIDYTGGTPDFPPAVPTIVNVNGQAIDPATPWSFEFLTDFSYDEGFFYPTLDVTESGGSVTAGETVNARIVLKDYRSNFQEQVLDLDTVDGSAAVDTISLTGPELPRP